MKRILLYILVLIALCFAPIKGANIGNLRPVEVVHIYKEENKVVIATDTGDFGLGQTGQAALANLIATTPGTIYLDTAEYLLFSEDAEDAVKELRDDLKKNVKVCIANGQVDLALAADFLPVHGKLPKLKSWNPGAKLPQLRSTEKRLILS
jgi:multisubunit Na+/H+ antiporter MnhE subunit